MGEMSLFDHDPEKSGVNIEKEKVVIIEEKPNEEIKMHHHLNNPEAVNIDVEPGYGANGYGYGCGMGGGFGAGLVGGLIGGGLTGNRGFGFGGYGMPYGYGAGYGASVSTGDMLSALEAVKASQRTSRDIFASQMALSHGQMVGDFATLQAINASDAKSMAQFVAVEKSVCETKNDLQREILESRAINAMEHCKTRETVMLGDQRILDKICDAETANLRDELCELRAQRRTDANLAVNTQIIQSLGNVNAALAGLATQVNGIVANA